MKKILSASILSVVIASPALAASGETETLSTGLLNAVNIKAGDDSYSVNHFKMTSVIQKSTHELFKVGEVMALSCVGTNYLVNKESTVEGNCVIKDASGDAYLASYSRKGVMGQQGAGSQTIKGLSGKYVGLSGTCTYEAKYAQNDGTYIATTAKCKYK
jgi:ABC-type uncharacterized transport system ATPase subunit